MLLTAAAAAAAAAHELRIAVWIAPCGRAGRRDAAVY